MTYIYQYPMAPVTATGVIFLRKESKVWVLLGKRHPRADAFPNYWCLPGGFVDVGKESTEQAMLRELREEVSLEVPAVRLFMMDDAPGQDPRYDQLFNTCWTHTLRGDPSEFPLRAGDDISEARWVPAWDPMTQSLAFGHNAVFQKALELIDN